MSMRLEEYSLIIDRLPSDMQDVARLFTLILEILSDLNTRLYNVERRLEEVAPLDSNTFLVSKDDYNRLVDTYREIETVWDALRKVIAELSSKGII